jgi:competence protein ComEA
VLSITRRHALVGAVALVAILFLASKLLIQPRSPTQARPIAEAVVSARPAPRPKLIVHVVGAVRRPGLYRLAEGARISDAVEQAGGATAKAELEQVNLAAPIADGQQVVVPRKSGQAAVPAPGTQNAGLTGPVSLSIATLEDLDALPGIGPVTAQKILDYRAAHGAFRSVEELDAIPGIGPARIEQLRELVVP